MEKIAAYLKKIINIPILLIKARRLCDLITSNTDMEKIKASKVRLSIVCIARNEEPYIDDWVKFHIHNGVQKFFFYDSFIKFN